MSDTRELWQAWRERALAETRHARRWKALAKRLRERFQMRNGLERLLERSEELLRLCERADAAEKALAEEREAHAAAVHATTIRHAEEVLTLVRDGDDLAARVRVLEAALAEFFDLRAALDAKGEPTT